MDFSFGSDWCGPHRSDGVYTTNRCGYATARSEFDQTCKDHDCCLVDAGDSVIVQHNCNKRFYSQNIGRGFVRSAAAVSVGYGYKPYRATVDSMKRLRSMSWDFSAKGPFDTKHLKSTGPSWNYEDLKGVCRSDMESRYASSSITGKRPRHHTGMTGERSVKRRITPPGHFSGKRPLSAKRLFMDLPLLQRERIAFYQLPREMRRSHANYLRAKWRLRHGRLRRARLAKARTLRGMFSRIRAANRIKRWYNYQQRRWRHFPKGALVHANHNRLSRYKLKRRYRRWLGKHRSRYLFKW